MEYKKEMTVMQLTPKERLIVALDVDNLKEATRLVNQLIDYVGVFKVGAQLFTSAGPEAIKMIQDKGGKVFLDLKYHDIPNTVAQATKIVAKMGVFMFTIHTLGGKEMLKAVVETIATFQLPGFKPVPGFKPAKPLVIGVSILTSLNQEGLKEIGINRDLRDEVIALAKLAKVAGVDGVVASTHEIKEIKNQCGLDFITVTPGIRPAGASPDDQKRIATAKEAIGVGADFIVVGRPIIAAENPVKVAEQIIEEIRG
ncbi:MAG: orotidine-5'-phosphate decarboxylase [bacterium]|nr:orotidine-5'-phosphate decarboxylase [bacterium]